MVEIIDMSKLPRDKAVTAAMELFGFVRSDAEFYVAVSRGEVESDVIQLDDTEDGE